jgi:hypothetical protein
MTKLQKIEYPVFYKPYIEILDGESSLFQHLEASLELFEQILYEVDEEKYEYSYQDGKWTLKEVVQHLIDAERVFVYRSLRFSRKDATPLMGYEENSYVSNYDINKRDFNTLLDEFCLLRRSTILMFQDFDEEILDIKGTVEGNSISVRALGFICSGHVLHHLKIIQERYV